MLGDSGLGYSQVQFLIEMEMFIIISRSSTRAFARVNDKL